MLTYRCIHPASLPAIVGDQAVLENDAVFAAVLVDLPSQNEGLRRTHVTYYLVKYSTYISW